jgi:hypothetical protein
VSLAPDDAASTLTGLALSLASVPLKGAFLLLVVPLPFWANQLLPQHLDSPAELVAHDELPNRETEVQPDVRPGT